MNVSPSLKLTALGKYIWSSSETASGLRIVFTLPTLDIFSFKVANFLIENTSDIFFFRTTVATLTRLETIPSNPPVAVLTKSSSMAVFQ